MTCRTAKAPKMGGITLSVSRRLLQLHGRPRAGYHARTAGLLQLDLQRNYDIAGRLSGFSRPVLIIQGLQDPIPESTAIQTHAILKHSEVIFLDRSGHFPWLEQPQAFYEHLQSFLRSDSRADLKP